ncbi:MAG: hypothetical protein M5U34_24350 [Chloroflexi bacterium]|nr:hypothetical protein [Chloroflexota bacterium]
MALRFMMQTPTQVNSLPDIPDQQPTYLAIGSFDGVHLGHQAVLRMMAEAAQEDGVNGRSHLFPHPQRVLHSLEGPYYLTTLSDRVRLLGNRASIW